MKRFARATSIACLAFLVACKDKDVSKSISNGIEKAILGFFKWLGKVILISFGVIVAWAGLVALGGAAIIGAFHRRKRDAVTVAGVVFGCAIVLAAWPLTFTRVGIVGVIEKHAPPIWGKGLAMQAVVALAIVIVGAVTARSSRPKPPIRVEQPPPPPAAPVQLATPEKIAPPDKASKPAKAAARAHTKKPAARTAKRRARAPAKSRS